MIAEYLLERCYPCGGLFEWVLCILSPGDKATSLVLLVMEVSAHKSVLPIVSYSQFAHLTGDGNQMIDWWWPRAP